MLLFTLRILHFILLKLMFLCFSSLVLSINRLEIVVLSSFNKIIFGTSNQSMVHFIITELSPFLSYSTIVALATIHHNTKDLIF